MDGITVYIPEKTTTAIVGPSGKTPLFWRATLKIHIMSDLLAKAMAGCI